METTIQILLWTLAFIAMRVICSGLTLRSLSAEEKVRMKKRMVWVDSIRMFCLWNVVLYASSYGDFMMENFGGIWNIIVVVITIIPKRLWKYVCIDSLEN